MVIVATIRALKYNGGVALADLKDENLAALEAGFVNLKRHVQNIQRYGLPAVVAINHFVADTDAEVAKLQELCAALGVKAVVADAWAKGGAGTHALAEAVVELADQPADFTPLYDVDLPIADKVKAVATKIYGAKEVVFTKKAEKQLAEFTKQGWDNLPVCIAKTQYSFSDDQTALGAPSDFTFHIREFVPKLGAGFIVALSGTMLTMPGLGKTPAAVKMTIDENGTITGLF